jgi:hypothetical protein
VYDAGLGFHRKGGAVPITYRIDAELGIARVIARGMSTPDDVRAYRRALLADPSFGPGLQLLVDATDLDTTAFTRAGLEALAQDWRTIVPANTTIRMAILVGSNAAYGLARMYEVFTENTPILARAFQEEAGAVMWLRETAVPRR